MVFMWEIMALQKVDLPTPAGPRARTPTLSIRSEATGARLVLFCTTLVLFCTTLVLLSTTLYYFCTVLYYLRTNWFQISTPSY